jgi:hypothetical protein
MDPQKNNDSILFSWSITAHEERERTRKFYFWFFLAVALLLTFAVWQKSFLFGVFTVLAAGTTLFISSQRAEVSEFTFTDSHFIIGNRESVYEYDSLSHYDLYPFSETDRELLLVFKEKFRPLLRVRYYKGDEEKIADIFASKNIAREKIEPSVIDLFSKIIGI